MRLAAFGGQHFETSAGRDRLFATFLGVWTLLGQIASVDQLLPLDVASCIVAIMAMRYMVGHIRIHNLIISISLLVLISFSWFAVFVLNAYDAVVAESQFDFSAFSFATVRTAFVANSACLAAYVLAISFVSGIYRPSTMFAISRPGARRPGPSWPTLIDMMELFGSWILIVAVFAFVPNVYQFPYPLNSVQPGNINFNLRAFLALIPFQAFLRRSLKEGWITTKATIVLRLTFYAASYCIAMVHGPRGPVTGLLLVLLVIDAVLSNDKAGPRILWILIDFGYALFAAVNWPGMRSRIAVIGWWPAFIDSFEQYRNLMPALSSDGFLIGSVPNMGQALFHFLYVIALVAGGDSCGFRTFTNLIPQQLPDILDGVLWQRPENDNWLLFYQYHHGGGFYVPANAYWNNGLATAVCFMAAFGACLAMIEHRFKNKPPQFLIAYFAFFYLVPVDLYYGIQGLVRCLEYGLIAMLAVKLFAKASNGRTQFQERARGP